MGKRPYLIKPNLSELCELAGRQLVGEEEILAECFSLLRGGVGVVAVSMGGRGALITDGQRAFFAAPPAIQVDSTVGAGDSMLAALLFVLLSGGELDTALASGTAAAAASVTQSGTNLATKELYEKLLCQVSVREIPLD